MATRGFAAKSFSALQWGEGFRMRWAVPTAHGFPVAFGRETHLTPTLSPLKGGEGGEEIISLPVNSARQRY